MKIRLFSRKDSTQIQSVARESWRYAYEGLIPERTQVDFLLSVYTEDALMESLSTSVLLVAEEEGEVIGFVHFSLINIKKEIELGALYILPSFHRRGIGTALLKAMFGYFYDVNKITVSVVMRNDSALDFYHSKGFKQLGEMNDSIFGFSIPTIVMEWRSNTSPNV
ncbi:GNAT family N-acetyltransferase [Cytobacillus kochii]|uniref:GNAT family N-acetyltransferase n=1 Tax=Cytobacillus kochii TaxID=859143 RepID=UPI00402A99C5